MNAVRQAGTIIRKDLVLTARRAGEVGTAAVFSATSGAVIGFSLGRAGDPGTLLATGVVLTEVFLAVFTALLSFLKEADSGTLDGLRSSPVSPEVVFLSKMVYTLIILEPLALLTYVAAVFFGGGSDAPHPLIILSSGVYLSAVSAFSSALTVFIEARGVLLPTLILVLSAPLAQNVLEYANNPWGPTAIAITLSGLGFAAAASWLSEYILEV